MSTVMPLGWYLLEFVKKNHVLKKPLEVKILELRNAIRNDGKAAKNKKFTSSASARIIPFPNFLSIYGTHSVSCNINNDRGRNFIVKHVSLFDINIWRVKVFLFIWCSCQEALILMKQFIWTLWETLCDCRPKASNAFAIYQLSRKMLFGLLF